MNNLKYPKTELLAIIKENRDKHREILEDAYEGFYKALVAQLDRMREAALAKKKVSLYVGLTEPVDQTDTYDRAIRMLEMTSDDEITSTEQQFSNYVLDEWNWKGQFVTSNMAYTNKFSAEDIQKYRND